MTPIFLDLLVIAFSCIIVFFAYRKGLIRTVIAVAGYIVAAVLAMFVSNLIAGPIFDRFVEPSVTQTVESAISQHVDVSAVDVDGLESQIDQVYDAMPNYLTGMLEQEIGSRQDLQNIIRNAASDGNHGVAKAVVQTGIRPMFVMLIRCVAFSILFGIVMIGVGIISRMLKTVDYIPVLGKLNSVLGGVLGIFQAVFWLYVIALILKIFLDLTGGQNGVINNEVIEGTYIFNIFYKYNPLLTFKI